MTRSSLRGPVFRASTLFLAAFLVLLVAACDSPEEKEARHLARGIEFAEAGDDAKAMVELRNVLRLNAKNAEALYEVGLIHERAERWPEAFAAFQAAAAERSGYIDANMKIASLALMSNEVAIAEKAAADILAVHPGNPDAEVLEAAVMLRHGDLERALSIAESVLAQDPRHENAIAVVVGALRARGRTDDALARIDESLALVPANINVRALKLAILEETGDVEQARAVYEELVDLDAGNIVHHLALSGFLQRQADVVGAERVLRDAIDRDLGTIGLGESLVQLVYRERGAAAAQAELERLIARKPENHRFRFLLAELLASEERFADAEAALRPIVEGSDKDAVLDAKAAIAGLHLRANERDGARTITDEVLAVNREHRGGNFIRGVIHLLDGNADEAIRSGRTALRRDSAWTPALKLVADGHLKKDETDLAIGVLGEVVSLDPADRDAAEMLATLLTRRGDFDAALTVWDRLIDSDRDPAGALQARAQIRLQQQNWTAAQEDISRLLDTPGHELGGHVLAGSLHFARSRYDQSREWFGKALDLQPAADEPLVGIVRAFMAEGEIDAALAFLEMRTESRPDDALAFTMKGELLAVQTELEAAAAAFETAISLQPQWPVPYRMQAAMHRKAGHHVDSAVAVLSRGLAAMPDEPELLRDLAGVLMDERRHIEAIQTYASLLDVQPADDLAANAFAFLVADHAYEDAEALDRALKIAERFRTSNNGWFLDTLGWLHYRKGDYPVATVYLERAVSYLGDLPQLRYHLGMALKASGQPERARIELSRAVVQDANYDGLDEAKAALAVVEAEAEQAAGG